jgi:hypothetical protein
VPAPSPASDTESRRCLAAAPPLTFRSP